MKEVPVPAVSMRTIMCFECIQSFSLCVSAVPFDNETYLPQYMHVLIHFAIVSSGVLDRPVTVYLLVIRTFTPFIDLSLSCAGVRCKRRDRGWFRFCGGEWPFVVVVISHAL